jgi:hypothetical protein
MTTCDAGILCGGINGTAIGLRDGRIVCVANIGILKLFAGVLYVGIIGTLSLQMTSCLSCDTLSLQVTFCPFK